MSVQERGYMRKPPSNNSEQINSDSKLHSFFKDDDSVRYHQIRSVKWIYPFVRLAMLPVALSTFLIVFMCFRSAGYIVSVFLYFRSNTIELPHGYANIGCLGALYFAVVWFVIASVFLAIPGIIAHLSNRVYIKLNIQGMLTAFAAFLMWYLAAVLFVLWIFIKNGSPSSIFWIVSITFGYLGFRSVKKGAELFAEAQKSMAMSASKVLKADPREPVLYLRSFCFDLEPAPGKYADKSVGVNVFNDLIFLPSFWTERRKWTFEEVLCKGMIKVGPVIAIGSPGERLPCLGACRDYVDENHWQKRVIYFICRAKFTCLVIGNSEGLLWEIRQLVNRTNPLRVLLVVPPNSSYTSKYKDTFGDVWESFVHNVKREVGQITLPYRLPENALGLHFDEYWNPTVITGRATIATYRTLAMFMNRRIKQDSKSL